MKPPRGLSMSAMRRKEMDTTRGRTNNRPDFGPAVCAPYPINTLQEMAIAIIKVQAAVGIRFHHAACVYPCEFSTSFMPATASAITGDGCATAGFWTADHISFCN